MEKLHDNLYIDIETVPKQDPEIMAELVAQVSPPGNYKKQETIDEWMAKNAQDIATENYQKLALNGLTCEVCSIAWALDDYEENVITRTAGDGVSEAELLMLFQEQLKEELMSDQGEVYMPTIVGHNVIEFDLKILKQRLMVNRLHVKGISTLDMDVRHGNRVFDTMKAWAGYRGYVKLDELFDVFSLSVPSGYIGVRDLSGADVLEMFEEGAKNSLSLYNMLDVHKTRQVHKRMT